MRFTHPQSFDAELDFLLVVVPETDSLWEWQHKLNIYIYSRAFIRIWLDETKVTEVWMIFLLGLWNGVYLRLEVLPGGMYRWSRWVCRIHRRLKRLYGRSCWIRVYQLGICHRLNILFQSMCRRCCWIYAYQLCIRRRLETMFGGVYIWSPWAYRIHRRLKRLCKCSRTKRRGRVSNIISVCLALCKGWSIRACKVKLLPVRPKMYVRFRVPVHSMRNVARIHTKRSLTINGMKISGLHIQSTISRPNPGQSSPGLGTRPVETTERYTRARLMRISWPLL